MVQKIKKSNQKSKQPTTYCKKVQPIVKAPKKVKKCSLSQRGVIAKTPGRSDFEYIMKGIMDPYHPSKNPNGYLSMLVADNKLCWSELKKKIQDVQKKDTLPEWCLGYTDMKGQCDFRAAVANMMQKTWIQAPVNPDNIAA